jgi:hypothetical protein
MDFTLFGNVGEVLGMATADRAASGAQIVEHRNMLASMDFGATWERVPAACMDFDSLVNGPTNLANPAPVMAYTPQRGGMFASVGRQYFKSTLPNMQPTALTVTL